MSAGTNRRSNVVAALVMLAIAGFFLLPVAIMVIGSLKSDSTVISDQTSLAAFDPRPLEAAQNYTAAVETGNYLTSLRVSLIVSGVVVLAGLVVNSLCGYALARLPFPGRSALTVVVVALVIIPFEAIAVPLLLLFSEVSWTNTIQAQFLPFIAQPLYIFLFYSFFRGIPRELEEAAMLDGASPFRIFRSVVVPLARPAYASAAILSFLFSWGQFLWPVMITRTEDVRPLPLGLTFFRGTPPVQWAELMAFAALMVVPVAVLFVVFQRQFVEGVARQGLKG